MGMRESSFIKACYGKNDGQIPVWIMRQAGRYLSEYLDVRSKVSFNELCRSPKLISTVVRQPIDRFGFDAAILFSDILTMLDPMGIKFEFSDRGPRTENTISSLEDIERLRSIDIKSELSFVLDGIREIKKTLPDTPLIGFAGSPFTLSCYMIEGKGTKNFDKAKRFLHEQPEAADQMFDLLSDTLSDYLSAQIDAGVDAVQLFGSWDGILSHDEFARWSAAPVNKIFEKLKETNVPRIFFLNNVAPYLDLVSEVNCEVVGVDYRIDLNSAAKALPGKSIQGNLDPSVLFGTEDHVESRTKKILDGFEDHSKLIFNLGHGIQPGTPIKSVHKVVETVHSFRS